VTSRQDALARRLSERLLAPADAVGLSVRGRTQAAVLIALFLQGGQLHAVLTRRRDDLRRHPGEISFPGGRREPEDDDLLTTALRETEEEIGLPREDVEVLGALQPTPTIATGYAVYPFIGLIEPGRAWTLSPLEVAAVLELSFTDLRAGHARRRLLRRGLPIRTETYLVGDDLIWGATARMLSELTDRLGELDRAAQPGV
jgi:8-oxo-dGTP pyrophosphatase MutT (NUDIX family)